jgi:hypothetical protein
MSEGLDTLEEYYNSFLFTNENNEISEEAGYLNLKQTTNLKINNDRLTVKYIGKGANSSDIAVHTLLLFLPQYLLCFSISLIHSF